MSIGFLSSFPSQVQSFLFPDLRKASDYRLQVTRTVTMGLMEAAGLVGIVSGVLGLANLPQRKGDEPPSITLKNIAVILLAGASFAASITLYERVQEINRILSAPELEFLKAYREGLLDRLTPAQKIEKYKAMVAKKGSDVLMYYNLNLPKLVEDGIATIESCRYETYGIDLKKVRAYEIDDLFPLRKAIHSRHPDLRQEAKRQEAQYQRIAVISARYPKREHDFGGHMLDVKAWGDDLKKEQRAKKEQKGYENDISQLLRAST